MLAGGCPLRQLILAGQGSSDSAVTFLGMLIGAAVAMLIGVVISYPTFRLKGPYFTLASIAICEIFGTFVLNTENLGPIPLKGGSGWSLTQTGYQAVMYEFRSKLGYCWPSAFLSPGKCPEASSDIIWSRSAATTTPRGAWAST